jgi:hypothetical protein
MLNFKVGNLMRKTVCPTQLERRWPLSCVAEINKQRPQLWLKVQSTTHVVRHISNETRGDWPVFRLQQIVACRVRSTACPSRSERKTLVSHAHQDHQSRFRAMRGADRLDNSLRRSVTWLYTTPSQG